MGDEANSVRARKLLFAATQLMTVARELELDCPPSQDDSRRQLEPSDAVLVELARQIYHARRERCVLAGWDDLFGEPAWDMLLDLFVAAHENRAVSVTSACIASGVPPTTALRWLQILEHRHLVEREADPSDQRRILVRISATGFAEFNRYLRHIADGHSAFVILTPSNRRDEQAGGAPQANGEERGTREGSATDVM